MKREQNQVARSIPKKPSGPKHIVCHHCGTFDHLRPHCSKFQALKRIKRKEKLELLGSCAKKDKLDLSDNSILLKKLFNALNSLSMCISGSHSSNLSLTFHETLIPNNCSVWMRKGSYGWPHITYEFLPCTFVQLFLCIYELSLLCMHIYLCGKNLEIYVWLL